MGKSFIERAQEELEAAKAARDDAQGAKLRLLKELQKIQEAEVMAHMRIETAYSMIVSAYARKETA